MLRQLPCLALGCHQGLPTLNAGIWCACVAAAAAAASKQQAVAAAVAALCHRRHREVQQHLLTGLGVEHTPTKLRAPSFQTPCTQPWVQMPPSPLGRLLCWLHCTHWSACCHTPGCRTHFVSVRYLCVLGADMWCHQSRMSQPQQLYFMPPSDKSHRTHCTQQFIPCLQHALWLLTQLHESLGWSLQDALLLLGVWLITALSQLM